MNLEETAKRVRRRVVEMSHEAGAGHVGSALSCVDLMVVTYWTAMKMYVDTDPLEWDRFILSKGHAAFALYAVLEEQRIAVKPPYPKHPIRGCYMGVEATTGSLGHGLSMGVGLALAARIQKQDYKTFVLMGDGECNEGSVWEAAMFAPAHRLNNLTVLIDCNGWQATGRTRSITAMSHLAEKWQAFGWRTSEVDGHDISWIQNALEAKSYEPRAIIAYTTKGKGVSFMEDDNNWHYRVPSEEDVKRAVEELK